MENIKELVFAGGHLNAIFEYLGALIEIKDKKLNLNLTKVEKYLGSSSGGLLAFFLCIGIEPDKILELMKNIPYSKISKMDSKKYLYLFDTLGIEDTNLFKKIFKTILEYKDIKHDITFEELYKITNKDLSLVTYCLNSKELKLLNHIFTPKLEVVHGLCMTIAIPTLFRPVSYENRLYVDPCVTCNFPVDYITHYDNFIGFHINSHKKYEEKIDFMRLLNIIYSSIGIEITYLKKEHCHCPQRIFTFYSSCDSRKSFDISKEEIDFHVNIGKEQIYNNLRNLENELMNINKE